MHTYIYKKKTDNKPNEKKQKQNILHNYMNFF